jgi:hypothetical protein
MPKKYSSRIGDVMQKNSEETYPALHMFPFLFRRYRQFRPDAMLQQATRVSPDVLLLQSTAQGR